MHCFLFSLFKHKQLTHSPSTCPWQPPACSPCRGAWFCTYMYLGPTYIPRQREHVASVCLTYLTERHTLDVTNGQTSSFVKTRSLPLEFYAPSLVPHSPLLSPLQQTLLFTEPPSGEGAARVRQAAVRPALLSPCLGALSNPWCPCSCPHSVVGSQGTDRGG